MKRRESKYHYLIYRIDYLVEPTDSHKGMVSRHKRIYPLEHARFISIVDDSADYRFLLQQLFRRSLPTHPVRFFAGGQDLLDALPHMKPQPSLILLDRHMPVLDGHQTLLQLKEHPDYCSIPVVMTSADASPEEINDCYKSGVNSFLIKPIDFDSMKEFMSTICHYWLEINQQISPDVER